MASPFEEVAKLLPQEQAQRFLTLVAQFKNVPDDDEYLQVLEAIGFMTLLWKEVPEEIKSILEGANPVADSRYSIAKQISDAVIEAIPSYEDLKQVTQKIDRHELALKRTLSSINGQSYPRAFNAPGSCVMLLIGALGAFIGHDYLIALLRP